MLCVYIYGKHRTRVSLHLNNEILVTRKGAKNMLNRRFKDYVH